MWTSKVITEYEWERRVFMYPDGDLMMLLFGTDTISPQSI